VEPSGRKPRRLGRRRRAGAEPSRWKKLHALIDSQKGRKKLHMVVLLRVKPSGKKGSHGTPNARRVTSYGVPPKNSSPVGDRLKSCPI
jgi:hypothetical protein